MSFLVPEDSSHYFGANQLKVTLLHKLFRRSNMHPSTILTALLSATSVVAQTTGKLGDAKVVMDNPPSTDYVAAFNMAGPEMITGWVNASTDASGKGVAFTISVKGFQADKGPFRKWPLAPAAGKSWPDERG